MAPRSLYIWHPDNDTRTGHKFLTQSRDDLWGVCDTLDIRELIICVQDSPLETNGPSYASLVAEAKGRGINCVALLGMSQADADKNYMRLINAIAAYNAKYPAAAFTGVSFDTEPWTNPNAGNNNYLAFAAAVQWFKPILPGLKFQVYDDTWPCANPTDDNKVSQSTYEAFAKSFNEVDIQSYGVDYNAIVSKSAGGLQNTRTQILNALGIPFRVLIETDPTAPSNAQISNKTLPYLKQLLIALDVLYGFRYPCYKGVCLHAWNGIFKIVGKVAPKPVGEVPPVVPPVIPPVVPPEPVDGTLELRVGVLEEEVLRLSKKLDTEHLDVNEVMANYLARLDAALSRIGALEWVNNLNTANISDLIAWQTKIKQANQ